MYTGIHGWIPKERLSFIDEMLPKNSVIAKSNIKRPGPIEHTASTSYKKRVFISSPKVVMNEEEHTSYLQSNLKNKTDFPTSY